MTNKEIKEFVDQAAADALVEQIYSVQRDMHSMLMCINRQAGTVDIKTAAKLYNGMDNKLAIINNLLCKFL